MYILMMKQELCVGTPEPRRSDYRPQALCELLEENGRVAGSSMPVSSFCLGQFSGLGRACFLDAAVRASRIGAS